jgi:hypothetical protein
MDLDAPFPVEQCPVRLRKIVLAEFSGRIPSLREVQSIPDREWLKAPGVGRKILKELRRITGTPSDEFRRQPLSALPVDELFFRLLKLQDEAHAITHEIWARAKLPRVEDYGS